jgi:hypothetical protein
MKIHLLAAAVLLCALPASGQQAPLSRDVIEALTPMDSVRSPAELDRMLTMPLDQLRAIALDPSVDVGVSLRAIRALPLYCPAAPDSCAAEPVHDTLLTVLDSYQGLPATPVNQIRVRAAIEALGATRSGLATDVARLLPLLDNGNRDLRVAVIHAMRSLCNTDAIAPLTARYLVEPLAQIKLIVYDALRDLHQCN